MPSRTMHDFIILLLTKKNNENEFHLPCNFKKIFDNMKKKIVNENNYEIKRNFIKI